MKFIKYLGREDNYLKFQFSKHNQYDVSVGDQIWSDGEIVEIDELVDQDILDEFMRRVSNASVFAAEWEKHKCY